MIPARGKNRVPTAADVILVRGTCHRPLPWPQKPETRSSPPPPVNLIGLPDQERLLGKVGLTSFRRRRGGSAADHRNDPGASPIAACPNPSWPSPTSSATPSCWTKTRPRGGRRDSRSRRTRPSLRGRTATGTRTTSSTSPFATTSPRTLGLDQRRNDGRRRRLPHRGQSRPTIPATTSPAGSSRSEDWLRTTGQRPRPLVIRPQHGLSAPPLQPPRSRAVSLWSGEDGTLDRCEPSRLP